MAYKSYIGDRYVGTELEMNGLSTVTDGSLFITTDTHTVFMRVNGAWTAVGAANLEDLTNVSDSAAADQQVLTFIEATGEWEPRDVTALLNLDKSLGGLTNVGTGVDAPPAGQDFLKWSGTSWETHQLVEADISDLQDYALDANMVNYQLRSEKNVANGYVGLNANTKIDAQYLPALAISEVFVVANIAARDALPVGTADGEVQEGDVAVVTDASADPAIVNASQSASYIFDGAAWQMLRGPEVVAPGTNTQVIFNDNGDFGASPAFTFDGGLMTLGDATTGGRLKMTDVGTALTDPALAAGEAVYYTVTGTDGANPYTRMMARIGNEDFIVATHYD